MKRSLVLAALLLSPGASAQEDFMDATWFNMTMNHMMVNSIMLEDMRRQETDRLQNGAVQKAVQAQRARPEPDGHQHQGEPEGQVAHGVPAGKGAALLPQQGEQTVGPGALEQKCGRDVDQRGARDRQAQGVGRGSPSPRGQHEGGRPAGPAYGRPW